MFSSGTPGPSERRAKGTAAVRRSQSRAGSIAAIAAGSDAGTPPPEAIRSGPRTRTLPVRAGSSRRQSHVPLGRTAPRAASRLGSVALFRENETTSGEDDLVPTDDEADQQDHQSMLLKSDTHSVRILGGAARTYIPTEVTEVLANSDFYSDPHTAVLDKSTGYACLVGRSKCYVWSIAELSHSDTPHNPPTPTCYTFPVPEAPSLSLSATVFSPVPFVAFVSSEGAASSSSHSEPGFLMVTTWGQVIYWRNISVALSGLHNHEDRTLGLAPGEVVRVLHALSPTSYIIATSASRLISLRLLNTFAANTNILIKSVFKARGMLARMGNLFAGADLDPRGGINAVASYPEPRYQRSQLMWACFAVTDRVIQEWKFSESGEEYIGELDIFEAITDSLTNALGTAEDSIQSIRIVDAAMVDSLNLVFLLAYNLSSTEMRQPGSGRHQTSYAIANMKDGTVTYLKTLAYTHEIDPRPLSSPRLTVISANKMCFVSFPDLIIATSMDNSLKFEESVALKDADKDRILGTITSDPHGLLMLAAHTGFIRLDVDIPHIKTLSREAEKLDPADLATRNLKSKLEQAVLFADNQQNPLTFNLALSSEAGDLVSAAESVSREILCSCSIYLPPIIDLRAQMSDRTSRLRFLMRYLHDNSLTNRLSKTSRRHLAWDAEKLAAATALWQAHTSDGNPNSNALLVEAAEKASLTETPGEDIVRHFFRRHTDRMAELFEAYLPLLHRGIDTSLSLNDRSDVLRQLVRDLTLSYKAITRHRIEHGSLYGIPPGPDSQTCLSEPWSSRPKLLDLMRSTFDATDALLLERRRVLGSNIDDDKAADYGYSGRQANGRARPTLEDERETQRSLKAYLVELADYTLATHQERMSYLQSLGDDAQAVYELRELLGTYTLLRPRVIDAMVRLSRANAAYDLAERYRDFRSLVRLCNDPSSGSAAREHHYMQKYQEEFAFALYEWYLETGRRYDLMAQDTAYGPMLSKFLRLRKLPGLAWMQDVAEGRVDSASIALLQQSEAESKLSEQKLMLSIGKLARVAGLTRAEIEGSERAQQSLEAIDDRLDIVASHDRLLDLCRSISDPRDSLKPVEAQATVLAERLYTRLGNKALQKLAAFLLRRLLLGDALSPEDLVDLFSLKDNTDGDQIKDFAYSLEILSRDRQTPASRREIATKCVWRRVYLADDFVEVRRLATSGSDEALAARLRETALYATILACLQRKIDNVAILRPQETLYASTSTEDASMLARFSSEVYTGQINMEAVALEYARESHLIQEMCDDSMVRLGELFDEVHRLAKLDMEKVDAQGSILAEMEDSLMQ